MSLCRIDHNNPDSIPVPLCRTCNPEKFGSPKATVAHDITMPEVTDEQKLRYGRKVKRRLRAEVKQIVGEIDKINGRNPPVTAQLEAKLAKAYSELAIADDV